MARLKLQEPFSAVSGHFCSQSGIHYGTNSHNGQVVGAKLCNPYTGPATDEQQTVRTAFTTRSRAVAAWFAANKPSETNAKGTEEYQKVKAAFDSDTKSWSLRAFVSKHMSADGQLTIGGTVVSTTSAGSSSGSGSSSSGDDLRDEEGL